MYMSPLKQLGLWVSGVAIGFAIATGIQLVECPPPLPSTEQQP